MRQLRSQRCDPGTEMKRKTKKSIVWAALFLPGMLLGEPAGSSGAASFRSQWSASLQSGIAQGMQLSLGGLFNPGPAQQNRLTITKTGTFRSRDSLQLYGWNTTDLGQNETDADLGIRYRVPVRRVSGGTLTAGTGVEYWHFPSVLGGQRDLALDTYAGWSGGERIPLTFSANGKTVLRSRLQHGTMGIFQVQHTQRLARWSNKLLAVNHGPIYVYNWNLYGRPGHRVLRYNAALQFSHGAWAFEALVRPQAGLQPRIPDNRFWSFSVIRRLW